MPHSHPNVETKGNAKAVRSSSTELRFRVSLKFRRWALVVCALSLSLVIAVTAWRASIANRAKWIVDTFYANNSFPEKFAVNAEQIYAWEQASREYGRPVTWKINKVVIGVFGTPVGVSTRTLRGGKRFYETWYDVGSEKFFFSVHAAPENQTTRKPNKARLLDEARQAVETIYGMDRLKIDSAVQSQPIEVWDESEREYGSPTKWTLENAAVVESVGRPVLLLVRTKRQGIAFSEVWRIIDGRVLSLEIKPEPAP